MARWGSALLYLAAIGVVFVNSLPFGLIDEWQMILQLVLLPLVVVAVFLRIRLPYLLPLLGVAGIVAGTFAVFIVGMVNLSIRRRGLPVWLLAAVGAALSTSLIVRRDLANGADATGVLLGAALAVIVVGVAPTVVGGYIRSRRDFAAGAAAQAMRATVERELAAQSAVSRERERIAQEMHDSLGHTLALVTMQAGALEVRAPDAEVAAAAEQIRESARAGLGELRAVVHALGADARRDPAPALAGIPELIEESRRAGAQVRLIDELPSERSELPSSTGRMMYQVVQEALTNAHRHAPGAAVDVVLSGARGVGIDVRVSNSLAPGGERGAGTGLESLRSRVQVLGGEVQAHASHGRFELHMRLPWEETT